jgi:hypothetical protein
VLSKTIMGITKSKRSHAAVFVEIWGNPYIVDAQRNGINPKPLQEWMDEYGYSFDVYRPPAGFIEDEKAFCIRAFSKVGLTGYGFVDLIIRHPWRALTGEWKEKNPYDKMTCGEYTLWTYGVEKAYRMNPGEVEEWCIQNNFTKV